MEQKQLWVLPSIYWNCPYCIFPWSRYGWWFILSFPHNDGFALCYYSDRGWFWVSERKNLSWRDAQWVRLLFWARLNWDGLFHCTMHWDGTWTWSHRMSYLLAWILNSLVPCCTYCKAAITLPSEPMIRRVARILIWPVKRWFRGRLRLGWWMRIPLGDFG